MGVLFHYSEFSVCVSILSVISYTYSHHPAPSTGAEPANILCSRDKYRNGVIMNQLRKSVYLPRHSVLTLIFCVHRLLARSPTRLSIFKLRRHYSDIFRKSIMEQFKYLTLRRRDRPTSLSSLSITHPISSYYSHFFGQISFVKYLLITWVDNL